LLTLLKNTCLRFFASSDLLYQITKQQQLSKQQKITVDNTETTMATIPALVKAPANTDVELLSPEYTYSEVLLAGQGDSFKNPIALITVV
jgi:hypothetical protein